MKKGNIIKKRRLKQLKRTAFLLKMLYVGDRICLSEKEIREKLEWGRCNQLYEYNGCKVIIRSVAPDLLYIKRETTVAYFRVIVFKSGNGSLMFADIDAPV